jgi:hypothetical protein
MNFSVSITGEKAIDEILRALPRELTHQVLGAAHFAAAKPLVEREKLLAPEGPTGNLVDSIGAVKTPIKRANTVGEVIVGPRRGRGNGRRGGAGHLVEFGTRRRYNRRGAYRGVMKPKPFAAPAFRQEKGNVEKLIAVSIGKSVLRTMRRYAR